MHGWKSWPLPELIGGGDWTVKKNHKGGVNLGKKTMNVPTDSTLGGITVRNHEMCHAAFTPQTGKGAAAYGVSKRALGSAEDYRIGQLGLRKGVKFWEYRRQELESLAKLTAGKKLETGVQVAREDRLPLAVYAVLSGQCFDKFGQEATMRAIPKDMHDQVKAAIAAVQAIFEEDPSLPFEAGIKAAKWLDEHVGQVAGGHDIAGSASPTEGDGIPEPFEGVYQVDDGVPWGELKIDRPRLVRRARIMHERKKGAKFRALEEGVIPARIHRMLVDQRVFHVRTGILGGTLLIDRSGSMGMQEKEVSDLVEKRPHVLVADYCGSSTEGRLRIVVRRGKTIALDELRNRPTYGGGNIVDGPALKWLIQQPQPRIWISDGHVTGTGDRTSQSLASQAAEIMAMGNVLRYGSVTAFMNDPDLANGKRDLKEMFLHAGFAWWMDDEKVSF